jgi:hypothetical protein
MVKVRVNGREGREMPSEPTALPASAAQAVVAAASTDAWRTAKRGVERLLGRGDSDQRLLDKTREQLQTVAGQEREQTRAVLKEDWRIRLTNLLKEHPEKDGELKALVVQIKKACGREQWRDALKPIPTIIGWYKANAFAGILLAAGFVVLKGYVIARGDLATALGILQYAGLATVVTAGLLSSLPILAAAMLAFTVIHMIRSRDAPGPRWRLAVVMLGAFVVAAMLTSWPYLVLAVVLGLTIGAVLRWHVPTRGAWPVYVLVSIIAVCAVILSLYTVWVPHETVYFRAGTLPANTRPRDKQVGYVLSEGNGWITMLTSGAHQIVRYPDADVITQMVCERRPKPGNIISEFREGATLWDEVTSQPHMHFLHPAVNQNCSY